MINLSSTTKKIAMYSLGIFLLGWLMLNIAVSYSGVTPEARWVAAIQKREEINKEIKKIEFDWCVDKLEKHVDNLKESGKPILSQTEVSRCDGKTRDDSIALLPVANAETIKTVDMDKLAKAVAWAETHDCELGYGKSYNNCFGIKNGSIEPCSKIGQNRMCIYESKEDSYEAFKEIWSKGYGLRLPTYKDAQSWTGNDRPDSWLNNVNEHYNK